MGKGWLPWFIDFNDILNYELTPVHLADLQFPKIIGWA